MTNNERELQKIIKHFQSKRFDYSEFIYEDTLKILDMYDTNFKKYPFKIKAIKFKKNNQEFNIYFTKQTPYQLYILSFDHIFYDHKKSYYAYIDNLNFDIVSKEFDKLNKIQKLQR